MWFVLLSPIYPVMWELKCYFQYWSVHWEWSYSQWQDHVCWWNAHADLLCLCYTCLPYPLCELKSSTVVLCITKLGIGDSVGKDLCFCPCLKTWAAFLPQQGRWIGVQQSDPTAINGPFSKGMQWPPVFALSQALHDSKRKAVLEVPAVHRVGQNWCQWRKIAHNKLPVHANAFVSGFLNGQMEMSQCAFSRVVFSFWARGCLFFPALVKSAM